MLSGSYSSNYIMSAIKFLFPGLAVILLSGGFNTENTFQPIAVVELFTSQGCSSCPPADLLLARTIADANLGNKKIFAMEFHVDYWNRLGWTDPFSDQQFTQRQQDYDSKLNSSEYTPQMIVNGKTPFVGSDETALHKALTAALSENAQASFKSLAASFQTDRSLKIHYELDGVIAKSQVCFALVSLSETTSVSHGENGGKTLTNENVVRYFETQNAASSGDLMFTPAITSSEKNLALIAFIQRTDDLKITGADEIRLQ